MCGLKHNITILTLWWDSVYGLYIETGSWNIWISSSHFLVLHTSNTSPKWLPKHVTPLTNYSTRSGMEVFLQIPITPTPFLVTRKQQLASNSLTSLGYMYANSLFTLQVEVFGVNVECIYNFEFHIPPPSPWNKTQASVCLCKVKYLVTNYLSHWPLRDVGQFRTLSLRTPVTFMSATRFWQWLDSVKQHAGTRAYVD